MKLHVSGKYAIRYVHATPQSSTGLVRFDLRLFDQKVNKVTARFKVTNHISAWAWKESAETGRTVLCGSHPEGVVAGEQLQLFSAFVLYALDGNGTPASRVNLPTAKPA